MKNYLKWNTWLYYNININEIDIENYNKLLSKSLINIINYILFNKIINKIKGKFVIIKILIDFKDLSNYEFCNLQKINNKNYKEFNDFLILRLSEIESNILEKEIIQIKINYQIISWNKVIDKTSKINNNDLKIEDIIKNENILLKKIKISPKIYLFL
jgi:hypothetical protein|uniref:Uncharacterized protein n=1 Tax=Rhizopogon salebrosus TaxID=176626 RepID=A0A4Y5SHS6_9AGAM|nr:hypothetical protein [Rhizopogon salebrosus]QDA23212.1 hypothetical protein [Rhizopogon salebrosus]